MLLIGYFEDISSQRGIAWRCEDSCSLARFLGYGPGETTPDHSTLTLTRERLPMSVYSLAFGLILEAAGEKGLLKGKSIGVGATDLEANVSLKSIVCKDNGDNWRECLRKLYEEETGNSDPDDDELRRFDKQRKSKKGHSLTFATPEAAEGRRFAASPKFASVTYRRPWSSTSGASCARCSERASRSMLRSSPRGFFFSILPSSCDHAA